MRTGPVGLLAQMAGLPERGAELFHRRFHALKQLLAALGERHIPRGPVQEANTHAFLERTHQLTER